MKTAYVLASLFVVLIIGLSYDSLAFGDHPTSVELTFNKINFEYGDTMIITAKLPQPFESTVSKTKVYLKYSEGPELPRFTVFPNSTGYAVFEIPLTSHKLFVSPITVTSGFVTYYLDSNGDRRQTQHSNNNYYTVNLNSDRTTVIDQHMKTLKSLNSTAINEDNIKLRFLGTTVDNIRESLDTLSLKVNKTIEQEIKVLRTSITNILTAITNLEEKNTDLEERVVKLEKHANNGTKHHGHP